MSELTKKPPWYFTASFIYPYLKIARATKKKQTRQVQQHNVKILQQTHPNWKDRFTISWIVPWINRFHTMIESNRALSIESILNTSQVASIHSILGSIYCRLVLGMSIDMIWVVSYCVVFGSRLLVNFCREYKYDYLLIHKSIQHTLRIISIDVRNYFFRVHIFSTSGKVRDDMKCGAQQNHFF